MSIRKLPEEVASAIAAGEVVERPASVIKELIENAIDAAATAISIRISGSGKSLLAVADDGRGIPADELKLAMARYSTSKLRSTADLHAIRSLGFRGEALAAIGAVARVRIQTQTRDEIIGSTLTVEGGAVSEPEAIGISNGTVVTVRDLFYNVPARRRFLKSDATERNWISRLVTRYAMAYPQIRFRLESEGRETLLTSGNRDRQEAIVAVFGHEKAEQMIPVVEPERAGARLEGYISPPFLSRANRREITVFVNGRWIQDVALTSAVVQAYHGMLMVGRYPLAILLIEIPPEQVDVNVHPAKAEVRFSDPGFVFSLVQRAVRATVLGQAPMQSIGIESSAPGSASALPLAWASTPDRKVVPAAQESMFVPVLRPVGQVGAAYLVAEGPDGIYLVDQHAAHERVLFERLINSDREPESQALLEAITVEFSAPEAGLVEHNLETLNALGVVVEGFGPTAFKIRAVPAALIGESPERLLRAVVEEFEEDEAPLAADHEARIAARVCKRAAIKAGQVLSLEEQRELLRDLERCQVPRSCPHGRPTMIHLSVDSLERQFGRRG